MTNLDVTVSMVFPILKTLVHQGYDTDAFCRFASFDPGLLRDVEARIDAGELERLTMAAAAYAGDDHFGLRPGQLTEFADLGVLGYVMLHSSTIADALSAYRRYNRILCSAFDLDWTVEGDDMSLRLFGQGGSRMGRHCVEDMAVSLYRLIGKLASRSIPLRGVRFAHAAPADIGPYEEAFGTIPRFGSDVNALILGKEALELPVLYSDAKLLGVFEAIARETLDRLAPPSDGVSNQVMRWLKRSFPTHFPTVAETAEALGISPRTLQLKLKAENTSYQQLTNRFRKDLAIGYLQSDRLSVGDIAYALHFSEPSAFHSAFKKWTGRTPGQYRVDAVHS